MRRLRLVKRKNHLPEFKAKVALEAIREGMTLADLSKKCGVHPKMIGTWKRAGVANMSSAFERGKSEESRASEAEFDKLHSKIGQLVVERDIWRAPLAELEIRIRPSQRVGNWLKGKGRHRQMDGLI